MKKRFNLLLGLLLIATGFNVVNADGNNKKGHYQPRLDLFQNAFRNVGDSLIVKGSLSKFFIYTEPGKFEKEVTDYEAWVPAETDSIYLGITHEPIDGTQEMDLKVPTYEVKGEDNAKGKVSETVYRWSAYPDATNGDTTLVHYTGDRTQSDSTQYYVFDFSKGAELTGSITITIPPGHVGYDKDKDKTTYRLTLKRSDDINKISGLKSLAVFEKGDDESILKDFDKFTTDYEVESAAGQDFIFKFEPILSGSTFEAFFNGSKVTNVTDNQALRQFEVSKAGGEVELIVTAPNNVSQSTYKIKIVQTLEIPSDSLKPKGDRYLRAESYIKRLYLTDGENEYDIYNKLKGYKFDGYLYNVPDSNTYIASVPDPSASNLELGYELHFDKAYKFTLNKQRFFVDKTTGQKISWTVHLKEAKDASKTPDPEKDDEWQYVFLDTIGGTPKTKNNNGDSLEVKYTIELLSNEARLEKLSLHFDSPTAPAVALSPAFDPDSSIYTLTSSVHKDLKEIYLVYKSFDKNAKAEIPKFNEKTFSEVPKTTYTTYKVSASDWSSGKTKYISISDTAVDKKTVKSYVIELRKDFDLSLDSIKIANSTETVFFSNKDNNSVEDLFKVNSEGKYVHDVNLRHDFVYDDLFSLDADAVIKDTASQKYVSYKAVPQVYDWGFTYIFKVKSTRGDTRDYLVNLILATNDATLDYLYTTPAGLTPEYSPEIFDYTLTVPATTASVRLIAATKDQFATLDGDGVHTITEGTTVLPITVTPGDKSKPNTYTVTVIKEGTGIKTVANAKVNVFASNGQLNVTSPYNERVYIHAADGSLIASFDKKAGNRAVSLNLQTGIIILRGSAGWTYKVFAK